MKTKGVLIGFFVVVAAAAFFWVSQPTSSIPVIGVLQFTKNNLKTLEGFKDGMKSYGYVEGENIRYVFDGPTATKDELPAYMDKLLSQKPDVIFASTTPAARIAKGKTEGLGIPVIFGPVNDPVSSKVVLTPQKPEGNVTGVRLSPSEGRRMQALKEVAPGIKRVLVPYNPADKSAQATLAQLDAAQGKLGVELVKKEFFKETNIIEDPAYVPQDIDAVFLPRDGLIMSRIKNFVQVCIERKLPLSTPRHGQVRQGALTGYAFVGYEVGKQAARMAHQVLAGVKVSELPVETARDYLIINMETAEKIGLAPPDAVLRRTEYIIRKTAP